MAEKLLEIKDLSISFGEGKNKNVAVKNANFDIYKGETFALVGESGSGKTTIGRAVMGLNNIENGDIIFDGKKINTKLSNTEKEELTKDIQMISKILQHHLTSGQQWTTLFQKACTTTICTRMKQIEKQK
jgi:oligopeptide transport system ATP-binding protein